MRTITIFLSTFVFILACNKFKRQSESSVRNPNGNQLINLDTGTSTGTDIHTIRPQVAISSKQSSPTNLNLIPFEIAFSEPVSEFDATDISVTNGRILNFSGTDTSYTFNIVPNSQGEVRVSVLDGVAFNALHAGNLVSEVFKITFDNVRPSLVLDKASEVSPQIMIVNARFSEPVTGFTSDKLSGTSTISEFKGSEASYSFKATQKGAEPILITLAENSVKDTAGNGNYLGQAFILNSSTLSQNFSAQMVLKTATLGAEKKIEVLFDLNKVQMFNPLFGVQQPTLKWLSESGSATEVWKGLKLSVRCYKGDLASPSYQEIKSVPTANSSFSLPCVGLFDKVNVLVDITASDFSKTSSVIFSGVQLFNL